MRLIVQPLGPFEAIAPADLLAQVTAALHSQTPGECFFHGPRGAQVTLQVNEGIFCVRMGPYVEESYPDWIRAVEAFVEEVGRVAFGYAP
jgi:hypothetical protein